MKDLRFVLSRPIAALLFKCLHENIFPQCLKNAHIVPIPKVDHPIEPSQFQPVTVLPAHKTTGNVVVGSNPTKNRAKSVTVWFFQQ